MKKQITLLSMLILFTATIFSCKKDTNTLKAQMMGKWTLSKIVVSGYTGVDAVTKNGTFTYGTTSDYMDFKSNEDDQVELSVSGNRTIGTYVITGELFNMSFPDGDSYCTVNSLTTKQFQFTAKIDKTNIVKVYYLTR